MVRVALAVLSIGFAASVAHAASYDSLQVVTPSRGQTVHDNNGEVRVLVRASPRLDTKAGERLTLLLDGRVAASGGVTHFLLEGLNRGTHELQAQVIATDGSVLASSLPVTFYMWHASRLFPHQRE
jgi:hypothetical protein